MPIDSNTRRAQPARARKLVSEIDPENTSIEECEAALRVLFDRQTEYQAAGRKPKLWGTLDGGVGLTVMGESAIADPDMAYRTGKCEGLFLGELLATIPLAERPQAGGEQRINSLNTLATAIVGMTNNHDWKLPLPMLIGHKR